MARKRSSRIDQVDNVPSPDDAVDEINGESTDSEGELESKLESKLKSSRPARSIVKRRRLDEVPESSRKNSKVETKENAGYTRLLWSDEDEIAILQGMIDYKIERGDDAYSDMTYFYEFVKDLLSVAVTKRQVSDKIRKLKKKYLVNVERGEDVVVLGKLHENEAFALCKKIWGGDDGVVRVSKDKGKVVGNGVGGSKDVVKKKKKKIKGVGDKEGGKGNDLMEDDEVDENGKSDDEAFALSKKIWGGDDGSVRVRKYKGKVVGGNGASGTKDVAAKKKKIGGGGDGTVRVRVGKGNDVMENVVVDENANSDDDDEAFELSKKIWGGGAGDGIDRVTKDKGKVVGGNGASGTKDFAAKKKKIRRVGTKEDGKGNDVTEDVEVDENAKIDDEEDGKGKEFRAMYPYLSRALELDISCSEFLKNIVMENVHLTRSVSLGSLDKKWKKVYLMEMKLYLNKLNLVKKQTLLVLDQLTASPSDS